MDQPPCMQPPEPDTQRNHASPFRNVNTGDGASVSSTSDSAAPAVTGSEAASCAQAELAEFHSSHPDGRSFPPSAWAKREQRYKQDVKKYEHSMAMQRERIAQLEAEVAVLREGGSIVPLENRIAVGGLGCCTGGKHHGVGITVAAACRSLEWEVLEQDR